MGSTALSYQHYPDISEETATNGLAEDTCSAELSYGRLEMRQWKFNDIQVNHRRMFFNDYYSFEKENKSDLVALQFNLKGSFLIRQKGNVYDVKKGQHNLIYSPNSNNSFQNRELEAEVFEIMFKPQAFLKMTEEGNKALIRFADQMENGGPVVMANPSPALTSEMKKAINDVLHCRFAGGLKKTFFLSKSIEMLVMQAEVFDRQIQAHQEICKNKADRERIFYACEYMEQHVESPPNLSELARIIGLNEYKLKKGFKEVFHTTVFGYLSDFRLELARQELLNTGHTIGEIAFALGYSSPQHFSTAFRKKFGTTPSQTRK